MAVNIPDLLTTLFVLAALVGLLASARPARAEDEGPYWYDERVARRRERDGRCAWRSMTSDRLCTRPARHRGLHDVPVQPDSKLLEQS